MMTKLDQFHKLFTCKACFLILEAPVVLPCGEIICKKDVEELFPGSCFHCSQKHAIPDEGFPSEKRLEKMLQLKVYNLNLGLDFKSIQQEIESISSYLDELELLQSDPDFYTYNYFNELRQQIESRRENLKAEIDQVSNKAIKDLDFYEHECKKNSTIQLKIQKEFRIMKLYFEEIKEKFDSFDMSGKLMIETAKKVTDFKPLVLNKVEHLKKKYLDNNSYKFKQGELSTNEYFGYLDVHKQVSFENF